LLTFQNAVNYITPFYIAFLLLSSYNIRIFPCYGKSFAIFLTVEGFSELLTDPVSCTLTE
jgi:hypothetical protein